MQLSRVIDLCTLIQMLPPEARGACITGGFQQCGAQVEVHTAKCTQVRGIGVTFEYPEV